MAKWWQNDGIDRLCAMCAWLLRSWAWLIRSVGCLVLTKKYRKLNTCMVIAAGAQEHAAETQRKTGTRCGNAAEDGNTLRECSGKHAYANESVRMQTF